MRFRRRQRTLHPPPPPPSPVVARSALPAVRVEQALVTLAVHTQQLDTRLASMEARMAACEQLAAELPPLLDLPTHDDLLDLRVHTAKIAAELSRMAINIQARIDDVKSTQRQTVADAIAAQMPDRRAVELAASIIDLSDGLDTGRTDLSHPPGDWAATA
jgi:hypothetical protein